MNLCMGINKITPETLHIDQISLVYFVTAFQWALIMSFEASQRY